MPSRPTADYDYPYPPEAIAQRPLPNRAASRLLVLDRRTGAIAHRYFKDFAALIEEGDLVVVNATRVVPARLIGTRENGRDAEILLVHAEPDGTWLAMAHPGGKLKAGRTVSFGQDGVVTVLEVLGGGLRRIRLDGIGARRLMERYGSVPLPPYISRAPDAQDRERYQTVFAREDGSVAAPTAGLHFDAAALEAIRARGGAMAEIVLHVGPGTFKPVESERVEEHEMHAEPFTVTAATAAAVNAAKAGGHRVWAVGTTVVRALEASAEGTTPATAKSAAGWTSLFIHEPYQFKIVDAMLTNFHLPRSTLLMLVAAFGGYEPTLQAYAEAVRQGYRLFSYGDAMVVL